jgi:hypothetical protein
MRSHRYVITVTDVKSGAERRGALSLSTALAVIVAVVVLPVLTAFGAAWKVMRDVQGLHASRRVLDIETANYRAAIDALTRQLGSQPSTVPGPGVASAESRASARVDPSVGMPVVRGSPVEPAPLMPAPAPPAPPVIPPAAEPLIPVPAPESASSAAGAPAPLAEALANLAQARAMADGANAPALASRSYQAAVALELEAQQFAATGRLDDALARAGEADAMYRSAEIEARQDAAALNRWRSADASSPVSQEPADTPTAPPEPPETARAESLQPAQAAVPPAAGAEARVRHAVAQYLSGLESRSLAALKRVWPTLGGNQERAIQDEFEKARTVRASFTDPRITITGDTGTVTGYRTYNLLTQDGQRLSRVTRTTMTLRRTGDEWLIERVVHDQ